MFEELDSADDNTTTSITDRYFQRLQGMTPSERMEKCIGLCNFTQQLVVAGILSRHPTITALEIRKRYAAITLGREFTLKHFNWDPEIEGY